MRPLRGARGRALRARPRAQAWPPSGAPFDRRRFRGRAHPYRRSAGASSRSHGQREDHHHGRAGARSDRAIARGAAGRARGSGPRATAAAPRRRARNARHSSTSAPSANVRTSRARWRRRSPTSGRRRSIPQRRGPSPRSGRTRRRAGPRPTTCRVSSSRTCNDLEGRGLLDGAGLYLEAAAAAVVEPAERCGHPVRRLRRERGPGGPSCGAAASGRRPVRPCTPRCRR